MLLGGWSHGVVAGLMLDVGRLERAAPLADEIGRAVGDPSLTFATRSGDRWLDEAGRDVDLSDRRRAVTRVGDDALLVHEPAALADAELARAATAAARLALGNARLRGEVAARVAELEASARRLVTAGDDERRRVAAAVEEGAELRLAAAAELAGPLSTRNSSARRPARLTTFTRSPTGCGRSGSRGDGLAGALDDLASRAQVPVEVIAPPRRFDDVVEATLFFVCSEALANVTKHAGASHARVRIAASDGHLAAEISDDGAGGADPGAALACAGWLTASRRWAARSASRARRARGRPCARRWRREGRRSRSPSRSTRPRPQRQ